MGMQDILEKLKSFGTNMQDALMPPGPVTGTDVMNLQRGPQENRGVGNILQNFLLQGSQRRVAEKGLKEEAEDRELKDLLTRAQASNLEALGEYRGQMAEQGWAKIDVQKTKNDIAMVRNAQDWQKAQADIEATRQRMELDRDRLRFDLEKETNENLRAIINIQLQMMDRQIRVWETEVQRDLTLKAQELTRQGINVQQGYLGLAQEAAPGERARTTAQTNALNQGMELDLAKFYPEQLERIGRSFISGQEAGLINFPAGVRSAGEKTGAFEAFGTEPIPETGMEKLKRIMSGIPIIGGAMTQPQKPAPTPTRKFTTTPAPKVAPPAAAEQAVMVTDPAGNRQTVRLRAGQTIEQFLATHPGWKIK